MDKKFFYIANWKMYWTFDETIIFVTKHYDGLLALCQNQSSQLVLCPSHPTIYPLVQMFNDSDVAIGAQDCSEHHKGAFTGQVSANNLKSTGCQYCIIGHSERRLLLAESSQTIANKCLQLLEAGIIPIICFGETMEQHKQGTTLRVLEEQLAPVIALLQAKKLMLDTMIILFAYEPVWAIGSGQIPTVDHLETVHAWLSSFLIKAIPTLRYRFIYGGSVAENTIDILKKHSFIGGLLIGGASLDFQELEKIVNCGT
jgi:triosephosphate isomerase (TIM)